MEALGINLGYLVAQILNFIIIMVLLFQGIGKVFWPVFETFNRWLPFPYRPS